MPILFSMLAPHVPSICHEENAPDFQHDMIDGLKQTAKRIEELKPDVIVLVSCHWPSTFFHYVDATPEHKGVLTAFECPDLIKDVPYFFPGDAELASQLVKAGEQNGIKAVSVTDPYYVWDYGSVVPLRYLVPNEDIPVINLSVTLAASLQETYEWGKTIKKVLDESSKNIVFVSSGALSHNLVRGRENKPTASEHALDKEFLQFIANKDYDAAYNMLPQYARLAGVESGGRHLAMLLSMLDQHNEPAIGAAGQSSGSWNAIITFQQKSVAI
ncbi:MEMO1 family protein [Domibacillus iocasae]|uniref:Extradiol ring-cleavage dioxygenase n=1 Tax=Domibacillus iocasae TaxID=1714016 RepID=A0A1E7DNS5_9BACI|nr:MEMO1 family protein [Domibacillus iocasae]OES44737.1 extradiol ring-cleavage dioxygenase [Domibacillus iocasae]